MRDDPVAPGAATRRSDDVAVGLQPPGRGRLAARRAEGTLTDVVQVTVRDAILAGTYQPGQKLAITTMAREQAVSLSVMREALTRLTVDGLVTSEAMQGFSVVQTSVQDLDELAELLKLLMTTAIRQSVANGGAAWEASLIAAHHLFKRAVGGEIVGAPRSVEVDRAHTAFWNALICACGNARLIALLTSLQRSMMLYHRIAIALRKDDAAIVVATYGAVAQHALDGDAEGAVRIMLDDIETATAACRAYLASGGNAMPGDKAARGGRRAPRRAAARGAG